MVPNHIRPNLEHSLSSSNTSSSSSDPFQRNIFPNDMVGMESAARTVHSLEAELIRLRESTKDALQQAWEEVETLQQQCTAHLEITTQMETDLMETKRREEYWHKRCLESEKLLLQKTSGNNTANNNDLEDDASIRVMGQEKNFISWPPLKLPRRKHSHSVDDSASKRTLGDMSVSTCQSTERTVTMTESDQEHYQMKVQELELKISSRDSAIKSLERTVSQHVKAMHTMQAEMQCMMETQRIKEKNAQSNFLRKEDVYEKQISLLQGTVQKTFTTISSQKKKIHEYKVYIGELTHELERVLKVIQSFEGKCGKGLNLKEPRKSRSATHSVSESV